MNRYGLSGGINTENVVGVLGASASYNATDWLRLSGNFSYTDMDFTVLGTFSRIKLTGMGASAKLFVPNWSFSPAIGVGYGVYHVEVTGNPGSNDAFGFSGTGGQTLSFSGGFDLQTSSGFNLAFGYMYVNLVSQGAPYLNLGLFF